MSTLADIVCKTTLKNDYKIKKLCEPIMHSFGFDIFWYYSITKEGQLCYISNAPQIAEFFYSQAYFLGHPYFKHPKFLTSGFFFADKTDSSDYVTTQGSLRDKVFMDQIFMVMDTKEDVAKGYGFATSKQLGDLTNPVLNNLLFFRKFINYFNDEAQDLYRQMHRNSVDIRTPCGTHFFTPSSYFDTYSAFEKDTFFSPRERECIKWFLRGLSATQIGKKVHLSNRTVEFYIENVKNRFGCTSRQELFDTLINSNQFLPLIFF